MAVALPTTLSRAMDARERAIFEYERSQLSYLQQLQAAQQAYVRYSSLSNYGSVIAVPNNTGGVSIIPSNTTSKGTMPKTKFKVGDMVEVIEDQDNAKAGMVGEINLIRNDAGVASVFFKDWHGGHDCGIGLEDSGQNIYFTRLKIVKGKTKTPPTLSSVVIDRKKIDSIKAAISQHKNSVKIFEEWGFNDTFEKGTAVSLLFYGIPGTGKTLMAQAITEELKKKLMVISTGDLETAEPGGFERKVKKVFKDAKKNEDVILFDECDSLLVDRNFLGAIMAAQVNSILTEIENFEGVVIFTTNRLGKLDPALERRITAKIEFSFPTKEERVQIWRRLIPKKCPLSKDVDLKKLAEFPLPGGNIKNCVLNAARQAAYLKEDKISHQRFLDAVEQELQSIQEFSAARESVITPSGVVKGMVKQFGRGLGIQ